MEHDELRKKLIDLETEILILESTLQKKDNCNTRIYLEKIKKEKKEILTSIKTCKIRNRR